MRSNLDSMYIFSFFTFIGIKTLKSFSFGSVTNQGQQEYHSWFLLRFCLAGEGIEFPVDSLSLLSLFPCPFVNGGEMGLRFPDSWSFMCFRRELGCV